MPDNRLEKQYTDSGKDINIMREVMAKAQELAEAILDSEIYQNMKKLEGEVRRNEEAALRLSEMIEKRQKVEEILSSARMNPDDLAKASAEMEEAEKKMNENPEIQKLKSARKDFQTMMDNVNQILRLIVTGQVEDQAESGSCTGHCESCGGCR